MPEAALNKNLIITSDFILFGDLFRDNIDGLIFKVNDHQELAEKMLEALNNPDKASQMAETFFNRSKEIFDPALMAEKHLKVYRECLKR